MNRQARYPPVVHLLLFFCTALLLSVLAWPGLALEPPPAPAGRITDETSTLSEAFIREMDQKLARFEEAESTQIAVLMIPTLAGDSLEDYSIRVAEKWRIGQAGKDNGVIVLVVKNDRKIRIEVGYGLEGSLPDSRAGEIIRTRMAPRFRQGDFEGGIRAALEAIMASVRGEYRGKTAASVAGNRPGTVSGLALVPFLGLFVIIGGAVLGHAFTYLRHRKIPLFLFVWSLGFAGIPMAMSWLGPNPLYLPISLSVMWLLAVAGGYRFLPHKGSKGGRGGSGSGWRLVAGGSGSGSFGGGFSGGGGSFGGGGASGSW